MKQEVRPLADWIYIKVTKEKAIGGIVIPDAHQEERDDCEVLAIGSKVKTVKVGDNVIVIGKATIRHTGLGLPKDELRAFIQEEAIVAVLKKEK